MASPALLAPVHVVALWVSLRRFLPCLAYRKPSATTGPRPIRTVGITGSVPVALLCSSTRAPGRYTSPWRLGLALGFFNAWCPLRCAGYANRWTAHI